METSIRWTFISARTSLDNKEVLTYLEQAWNRTGRPANMAAATGDSRQRSSRRRANHRQLTRDFNFRIHPSAVGSLPRAL